MKRGKDIGENKWWWYSSPSNECKLKEVTMRKMISGRCHLWMVFTPREEREKKQEEYIKNGGNAVLLQTERKLKINTDIMVGYCVADGKPFASSLH